MHDHRACSANAVKSSYAIQLMATPACWQYVCSFCCPSGGTCDCINCCTLPGWACMSTSQEQPCPSVLNGLQPDYIRLRFPFQANCRSASRSKDVDVVLAQLGGTSSDLINLVPNFAVRFNQESKRQRTMVKALAWSYPAANTCRPQVCPHCLS